MTDHRVPGPRPFAAAFAHRDFTLFQAVRLLGVLALQMQGVAVGWDVYRLTNSALHLGYVGLAQFLPVITLSLIAGSVADRFERRRVLALCHGLLVACAIGFALLAHGHLAALYAILVVVGVARAFSSPAGAALLPSLVPVEDFPNAVAWSASTWQLATIVGPALGGLAYGVAGSGWPVYVGCAVLEIGVIGLLTLMRRPPRPAPRGRPTTGEIVAGLRFIAARKLVLGSISLDLFAVLLGGAVALLPIYARDILHVGPSGLGVLRSAPALGAALMALFLAFRPLARRAGPVLLVAVAIFGAATIVFGVSRHFVLSLAALFVLGASDMISVFIRNTVVQLATPDAMRGRVSAVNFIFIGASNELGELESGVTAAWFGTVPAVVIGGLGTLIVVGLWSIVFPVLRRIDRLDPESIAATEGAATTVR